MGYRQIWDEIGSTFDTETLGGGTLDYNNIQTLMKNKIT